jgi:predicted metalloprotease with PDZ domain
VEGLGATLDGQPALVVKETPHSWHVQNDRPGTVVLSYRVYAHELTVRTAHLDDTHGFFNGVNLFMLPEGQEYRRCLLRLHPPPHWKVRTTLPQKVPGVFEADDYHHLVDCPVEMSTAPAHTFSVRGIPHELVLWNHGNEDPERLQADLARLVEANAQVFGGLPYQRYLFIALLSDGPRGGLEHRDSTALVYPRFGFRPEKEYESFLTLACHEHFHLWNVKRIKPKAFSPYDYSRENPTRLLWAMEGFTSYYDNLNTRRAGLMTADRYLAALGELITSVWQTPGRRQHSLEDASLDAWIKYYRPDEHTPNSTISYYLKGELVGLCLDLNLRHLTCGQRSLDDVMRLLWKRTSQAGEGLEEDAVERAAEEVAGKSLRAFFDLAVRSTEELPLEACLAYAGLALNARAPEGSEDKGGTPAKAAVRAFMGAQVRRDGAVAHVQQGGPAMLAGLSPGDQIVALQGWRAGDGGLANRLEELRPGDSIPVHFFRRDELRATTLVLGEAAATAAWLSRTDAASADALAVRRAWLVE